MKETLRQMVEAMIKDLVNRRDMLDKHIYEYAANENYEDANTNQIRRNTIEMVIKRLEEILK